MVAAPLCWRCRPCRALSSHPLLSSSCAHHSCQYVITPVWAICTCLWGATYMHHSMRSQGTYITIYVLQVPYDAHLEDLFFGEEMLMSLLLWRSGYAFFAPCDPSMVWHQWSRAGRPTFWEQRRSTRPPRPPLRKSSPGRARARRRSGGRASAAPPPPRVARAPASDTAEWSLDRMDRSRQTVWNERLRQTVPQPLER